MDIPRRMTKQRQIILDSLMRTKSHPTADELYVTVRKELPKVSLGTVYRNLELLAETGEAKTLDLHDGPRRYDADVSPHYHILCVECGKLVDVPFRDMKKIGKELVRLVNFELLGFEISLKGVCEACSQQSKLNPDPILGLTKK